MSNLSSPPPSSAPTTLPDALVQLAALRTQLAATTRAIHRVTGFTLDELLEKGGERPVAPESTPADDAEPPVDISSLVLKALAVRKAVQSGSMSEQEAEAEIQSLLPEGVTEDQVANVRQWAGL